MSELQSIGELAAAVGKSKSTVHTWIQNGAWPFSRTPPWPADQADAMREWAAKSLRPDRNYRNARWCEAPGEFRFKGQDLLAEGNPFNVRDRLGEVLASELNLQDLEAGAEHLNEAVMIALREQAEALGLRLRSEAPAEYFRGLLAQAKQLGEYLERGFMWFVSRRFIDRPGWWSELPKPIADPPAEYLADLEPLEHRAAAAGSAKASGRSTRRARR